MKYKRSKNYVEAFKNLFQEKYMICFVDFRFRGEPETEEPSRDICSCRYKENEITFGSRGIEYGSVDIENMSDYAAAKKFFRECERLNAEFVLF